MQESSKKSAGKERGNEGKSPKRDLTSAKDLTIELFASRYHKLD